MRKPIVPNQRVVSTLLSMPIDARAPNYADYIGTGSPQPSFTAEDRIECPAS